MSDDKPQVRILSDPQDPLPEANWFWRRVFTFVALLLAFSIAIGLAVAVNRIVGNVVGRIDTMSADSVAAITVKALSVIEQMFKLMFFVVLVVVTYYMIAPSAEQITKMIQTARLLQGGVQINTRAKVETPERVEETAATVGVAPAQSDSVSQPSPSTSDTADALPDAPWAASSKEKDRP